MSDAEKHSGGPSGPTGEMPGVDGLVAAVEKKMSELMTWHEAQNQAFASEKEAHAKELAEERRRLAAAQLEAEQARQRCEDKIASADRQRHQLRQAGEVLQQRQQTLQEELSSARNARQQAEKTASELERQRTRAADQTQRLIDAVAGLGSDAVVIGDVKPRQGGKKQKQRARRAA